VAARCGLGLVKGFATGIVDSIFSTAEAICASVETCLGSKIGKITGVIAGLFPPLAPTWLMGCYVATMAPQIAGIAGCIKAISSSPALQEALLKQAYDFVCEFAGGLIMDVVLGALTGGATAAGSVAAKVAKVAQVLKKISDVTGAIDKIKLVTIFGEAKKINESCGKYGVNLPTSPDPGPSSPPPVVLVPETPPAPSTTTTVVKPIRIRLPAKKGGGKLTTHPVSKPPAARPPETTAPGGCGRVSSGAVNLRAKPNPQSAWVGLVFQSQTFEILEEGVKASKWAEAYTKVRWNGKEGFLPARLVKPTACP